MVNRPRIVIAGTKSGVGKTSIATGLMAAFTQWGLRVQGFKVGPDYIDPGYHTVATGRPSRNLDSFLVPPERLVELFARASADCDIAVIEGVMGLFDGRLEDGGSSTAAIAKLLKAPVLLVVDVTSLGQSAAALVLGYSRLDSEVKVVGVILNRVSSPRHLELVRSSVEQATGIPVVGWLPRDAVPSFPSRHLGLVPAVEQQEIKETIKRLGYIMARNLDLKQILRLSREVSPLPSSSAHWFPEGDLRSRVSIGLALDEAFNFYYQDALDYLRALGAELVPFSPLKDETLPKGIAGLLIGGGFPEVFLPELSANRGMLQEIRRQAAGGLPIFAECGGLMYLCRGLQDKEARYWPLAGIIPAFCRMEDRLVGMGYRRVRFIRDTLFNRRGEIVYGHEFHYSSMRPLKAAFPWAYAYKGDSGLSSVLRDATRYSKEGFAAPHILASYLHTHFVGNPKLAENFLRACLRYQRNASRRGRNSFCKSG